MTAPFEFGNIEKISSKALVGIHNHFAALPMPMPETVPMNGEARRELKKRVRDVLAHAQQKGAVPWNERVAELPPDLRRFFRDDVIAARFDRLDDKELAVLHAIYDGRGRWSVTDHRTGCVYFNSLVAALKGDPAVVMAILVRLYKKNMVQIVSSNHRTANPKRPVCCDKVHLFWTTFEWVIQDADYRKKGILPALKPVDMMTHEALSPGPDSPYNGKRIYKLAKVNPHRPLNFAYECFNLITEGGMRFEDYKAAGGKNRELRRDIAAGHLEIR